MKLAETTQSNAPHSKEEWSKPELQINNINEDTRGISIFEFDVNQGWGS